MQAVGSEVIVAIFPLLVIIGVIIFYSLPHIKRAYDNWGREEARPQPVVQHPRFGGGQCSICLERKRYELSTTCGHSFCGTCLLEIYARENDRIQCPLCRRIITIIFRVFNDREGTEAERRRISHQIHEYNYRFDDNRPLWRRITELPYVIRRLRHIILRPAFLILFIRSVFFLRFIFFFILYAIMPFDLIPERVFGIFGFLDDIFVGFFMLLFAFGTFGLLFLRARH